MTFSGGLVFWLLVGLAAVAVVAYFERLLDLRRAQIDWQDFLKGVVNVLDSGNTDEALAICEDTPLGRLGEPEEIAKAMFFLQSDKASFITGQIIGINGGYLI